LFFLIFLEPKALLETTAFFNSLLGLGLYIVREVARAHGGEIDVRSDNRETVFAVRLPRRNEAHRPEQDQRIPSNSQENAWDKAPP
jgi:light-regulated signal transduction histidine kinase (bacteriophytochrome)